MKIVPDSVLPRRFWRALILGPIALALVFTPAAHAAAAKAPALAVATTSLPASTGGVPYAQTLTAINGTAPYTWAVQSGGLPPGLKLNATTGLISGTPDGSNPWVYAYPFSIYVRVKDSKNATAYASLALPEIAPVSPPPSGGGSTGGSTGGDMGTGGSGSTGSGGTGSGGTTTPPPPPPVTKYTLTVTSGTGAGSYAAGAVVSISANAAQSDQTFAQWTGATVANATSANTTITMPAADTAVTATYAALPPPVAVTPAAPANPILFVTQIPIGDDFTTIASAFGNHRSATESVGRGGDLYIRYTDGSLRNLTAAAGYGVATGFQGATSIAVRDPAVHWSGQKALFSMVVGAPTTQYGTSPARWQIYEITGLGSSDTPVVTLVPNQPASYNNLAPCYGTDGRILFTSDRPRNGQSQLYPQLDEYELAPTTTGLWSLDPVSGDLFNLNHTPSGAFTPTIDSFGRVIFVRWDHLQRDQEADIDNEDQAAGRALTYGTFNYSDETAGAAVLTGVRTELFPETRLGSATVAPHTFNVFFPWMINEDGTAEETINHIGRHELSGYMDRTFINDPNLVAFNYGVISRPTFLDNFLQLKEDPTHPGRYFGTDGPEFATHASGQILAIDAPVGVDADHIPLTYITDPLGKSSGTQAAHPGHFRDPLPLANGTLVAVHTAFKGDESKRGVGSDYDFRLKSLQQVGNYYQPYQTLTSGISKSVTYYANGELVSYNGPLWEMNPVEVRARPIPAGAKTPLPTQEQQVFAEAGVDVATFQAYLRKNNLALIVSRDLTTRDHADRQQPFNLHVAGSTTQTIGAPGTVYDVSYLQLFQGDQIRGFGLRDAGSAPVDGRRVLAQPLHDPAAVAANPAAPAGPAGAVQLGADGSMAAFLPARRATTWQLTDAAGTPTVRERYWLTFQPGEIRSCTSCHGVNTQDQAGRPAPTNKPDALRTLLLNWKAQTGN